MPPHGHSVIASVGAHGPDASTLQVRVSGVARSAVSQRRGPARAGLADGSVYCWGANDRGQLGGSSAGGATPVPIEVGGS